MIYSLFLAFQKGKRNNQNIHLPYCEHQIVAKSYQHGQQEQNAHIYFHIRYTVSELHEYAAVFKHLPPLRLGAINTYKSSSFHEPLIEQKVTLPGSNGSQAEKKQKRVKIIVLTLNLPLNFRFSKISKFPLRASVFICPNWSNAKATCRILSITSFKSALNAR